MLTLALCHPFLSAFEAIGRSAGRLRQFEPLLVYGRDPAAKVLQRGSWRTFLEIFST